ncbi:MAG: F0F1 ATP synthase subunit delta [Propionibacteriaceae bacterium]|jgi:F-type H+-transporting ATPase subunit delta|nr:F0F1 ATP synthase subunit delta [Propionibacteriaceae bacterium]
MGAPATKDAAQVVLDLSGIARALDDYPALARALTDPSAPADAKTALVDNAFGTFGAEARTVVKEALDKPWDSAKALQRWVEVSGVEQAWAWALANNSLRQAIHEVFSFSQIVAGDHELRKALTNRRAPLDVRQSLASAVTASMSSLAKAVVGVAVGSERGTIDDRIAQFIDLGVSKLGAKLAVARVASPMDEEQRTRLIAVLSAREGADIVLEDIVDPSVLGGVRVECGADVIDSTMAARLEAARRALG